MRSDFCGYLTFINKIPSVINEDRYFSLLNIPSAFEDEWRKNVLPMLDKTMLYNSLMENIQYPQFDEYVLSTHRYNMIMRVKLISFSLALVYTGRPEFIFKKEYYSILNDYFKMDVVNKLQTLYTKFYCKSNCTYDLQLPSELPYHLIIVGTSILNGVLYNDHIWLFVKQALPNITKTIKTRFSYDDIIIFNRFLYD